MPSQTKWRNVGWKTSTFFIQRLQTFFLFLSRFLRFLTFFYYFFSGTFFTSMPASAIAWRWRNEYTDRYQKRAPRCVDDDWVLTRSQLRDDLFAQAAVTVARIWAGRGRNFHHSRYLDRQRTTNVAQAALHSLALSRPVFLQQPLKAHTSTEFST